MEKKKNHLEYYKYLELVREKCLDSKKNQRNILKLVLENYNLKITKNQINREIININELLDKKIKKEKYIS